MLYYVQHFCEKGRFFRPAGGETRSPPGDTPDMNTHRVTR